MSFSRELESANKDILYLEEVIASLHKKTAQLESEKAEAERKTRRSEKEAAGLESDVERLYRENESCSAKNRIISAMMNQKERAIKDLHQANSRLMKELQSSQNHLNIPIGQPISAISKEEQGKLEKDLFKQSAQRQGCEEVRRSSSRSKSMKKATAANEDFDTSMSSKSLDDRNCTSLFDELAGKSFSVSSGTSRPQSSRPISSGSRYSANAVSNDVDHVASLVRSVEEGVEVIQPPRRPHSAMAIASIHTSSITLQKSYDSQKHISVQHSVSQLEPELIKRSTQQVKPSSSYSGRESDTENSIPNKTPGQASGLGRCFSQNRLSAPQYSPRLPRGRLRPPSRPPHETKHVDHITHVMGQIVQLIDILMSMLEAGNRVRSLEVCGVLERYCEIVECSHRPVEERNKLISDLRQSLMTGQPAAQVREMVVKVGNLFELFDIQGYEV